MKRSKWSVNDVNCRKSSKPETFNTPMPPTLDMGRIHDATLPSSSPGTTRNNHEIPIKNRETYSLPPPTAESQHAQQEPPPGTRSNYKKPRNILTAPAQSRESTRAIRTIAGDPFNKKPRKLCAPDDIRQPRTRRRLK